MPKKYTPLTTSSEWSFDMIDQYFNHIERIARDKFKLEVYPNQVEIIYSEQMVEAYSSHAMPIYYEHWSAGLQFIKEMNHYKKGRMGLAYEIVINSSPCIAYLMDENTMMMQILVMAHACFGHNHFFKNNYMFKQWTDAEFIIDYLLYAKKFIRECELSEDPSEVEAVLDACHTLQHHGLDKYKRPSRLTAAQIKAENEARDKWIQQQVNVLWSTIPIKDKPRAEDDEGHFPKKSQENILKFIEENAPNLPEWKREIIRIVRTLSQYFYPQMSTRLMNEGFATFMHYHIIQELHAEGLIDDGYMMEFIQSHTNVVAQPAYDSKFYSGINVYALGFAMFMDIKRVSMDPTEEDRNWFRGKDWVGNGKWLDNILFAAKSFKDEAFVLEYLSPKVIRDFKLFSIVDDDRDSDMEVSAIHNDQGYRRIREDLSESYNVGYRIPEIHVAKNGVDIWGDRSLKLEHVMRNRIPLDEESTTEVLKHARTLWGYNVTLESIDENGKKQAIYEVTDKENLLNVFIDDGE